MKNVIISSSEDQLNRLKFKSIHQQLKQSAIQGTGMSPWEAEVLINIVEDVYFNEIQLKQLKPGQLKRLCVSSEEGPGKTLKECKMISVILTLFSEEDNGNFSSNNNKDHSVELRRRRLLRITEEAKEQGGLLSQEDLAEILMCDVRTIRRDVKELKILGITVPTRGQQKDIGPGITHRALAVRLWLEGKEPVAIAQQIKHSIQAVENYLQKFKRVSYLRQKNFNDFEIALTIGISTSAAKTFAGLHEQFKNKPFFIQRLQEINLVGGQYYITQDEKKRSDLSKNVLNNIWRNQ